MLKEAPSPDALVTLIKSALREDGKDRAKELLGYVLKNIAELQRPIEGITGDLDVSTDKGVRKVRLNVCGDGGEVPPKGTLQVFNENGEVLLFEVEFNQGIQNKADRGGDSQKIPGIKISVCVDTKKVEILFAYDDGGTISIPRGITEGSVAKILSFLDKAVVRHGEIAEEQSRQRMERIRQAQEASFVKINAAIEDML